MVHSAATKAKISASLKAYHACARKAGCGKSNARPRTRVKPKLKPTPKSVPAAPRRKANVYKRHGSSRVAKRRLFAAPAKKAPPRRRVALTTTARPGAAGHRRAPGGHRCDRRELVEVAPPRRVRGGRGLVGRQVQAVVRRGGRRDRRRRPTAVRDAGGAAGVVAPVHAARRRRAARRLPPRAAVVQLRVVGHGGLRRGPRCGRIAEGGPLRVAPLLAPAVREQSVRGVLRPTLLRAEDVVLVPNHSGRRARHHRPLGPSAAPLQGGGHGRLAGLPLAGRRGLPHGGRLTARLTLPPAGGLRPSSSSASCPLPLSPRYRLADAAIPDHAA